MTLKINYVLGVILNSVTDEVAFLKKDRGPEYLVGKYNYMGGKMEPDESAQVAVARETTEECGLVIPFGRWWLFDIYNCDEYNLFKYVTDCPTISEARTVESEEVFVKSIASVFSDVDKNPSLYAESFRKNLVKAIAAIPKLHALSGNPHTNGPLGLFPEIPGGLNLTTRIHPTPAARAWPWVN